MIVITGTSRGIGKFLAEYYLQKGHVVVGCSRSVETIVHDNYYHYVVDVSDEKDVVYMFDDCKRLGVLRTLINNAGIASMNHSFLTPYDTALDILKVNIMGTFLCSRTAAKKMKQGGRIINFASFAVPFKLEGESVYAASKAAIISLTETLSKEYSRYNITVNAVAPPAVKTALIKNVPEDKMNKLLTRQTIHRYGTEEEVARVVDFFIDNPMITGETIYMGGV